MPKNPTVRFETLGCKLNQIESESAARSFADCGFTCRMEGVAASSVPDTDTLLCIVNTCTVTAKAEQKCRRIVRLLLEKYPHAALLITGCYAQLDGNTLLSMDDRIAVLGGQSKGTLVKLPRFLRSFILHNKAEVLSDSVFARDLAFELRTLYAGSFCPAFVFPEKNAVHQKLLLPEVRPPLFLREVSFPDRPQAFVAGYEKFSGTDTAFALSTDTFLQHSRPSLKIQDGCDNRCSYCRICFARGSSVSLEPETVLSRVLQLERLGNREVVLTGVNLSQYRFAGCSGTAGIADLLDFLLRHTSCISLRLSSLHPQSIDEDLCCVLAHERIRPHFHLSVQSGSDAVLCAMKRPYKAAHVCNAVENLRRIKKTPFIACDIIAGFPGETRDDFEATVELCRVCNFSWIHAFPFSPRPGTEAFFIKPAVASSEVKDRIQKLGAIALAQKKAYIENCIGRTFKAVVEKYRKEQLRAVTENFLHVRIKKTPGNPALKAENIGGKEVNLCIQAVYEDGLRGEDCEAFAVFV